MTLPGPSGCGKTTTLRNISGLENPQNGTIRIDGKTVVNCAHMSFLPSSKRGLDLVFQSYALWPHMTVFENVAFGLQLKKLPKHEISDRVEAALKRMHIQQYTGRYPNELSGGQQQRVAIARAIVSETSILLLDEPLSNLDAKLRVEMRSELKRLHQELGTTIVYVTHDQTEALTMSTKIALFFDGVLVQCDKPMDVYRNPATLQVADFIGNPKINFIDGIISTHDDDAVLIQCGLGKVRLDGIESRKRRLIDMDIAPEALEGAVVLAIRPEHIHIYDAEEDVTESICVEASVYSEMPAGSETLIQLTVGSDITLLSKYIGEKTLTVNQKIYLGVDSNNVNLFSKENQKAILGMR